jgi:ATP-dependent DNA helicase RecQ
LEKFTQILTRYWGYSRFRPLQEEIIQSVYDGRDTLGLMPTGGGKSITFQVPALAKDGLCIVITPLIALMKDQVENLRRKEINAISIHSGMGREEIDIALDNCIYGEVKFLYLSPERLETDIFRARIEKMNINLIAVDESHCVSQWGYDFRPSYMKIARLRDYFPAVPFLALTATATPKVVEDIMERLEFREKNVFRKSFERKNLVYDVEFCEDKVQRIIKIINENPGTGIIYCRNRKKTRDLALILQKQGIRADYYNAGLSHAERNRKQEEWQKDKMQVIISTNAFGMGIDKPDVRFVIHLDLPDALEAYYQEAGRAGRDEKPARAVLLYNEADRRSVDQRIQISFPDLPVIKEVYNALGNYFQIPVGSGKEQNYDFILSDFISKFKFNALIAHNSLKVLQREGYIEMTEEINNPSRVHFKVARDDLYKFQIANENLDGFIKLLLRSYSGMFSSFVAIDENLLAKRSGIGFDGVYKYLLKLSNAGIIQYIPRKKNPVIFFTEERLDSKNLHFSVESYKFLKERYIDRANEMLLYASGHNKCRSQVLLSYFGEKNAARCGQCDVCRKRNELDLSSYEFDLILEELKGKLLDEHLSMDEIMEGNSFQEDKVIKVFRWLCDHEKILRDDLYMFYWAKQ